LRVGRIYSEEVLEMKTLFGHLASSVFRSSGYERPRVIRLSNVTGQGRPDRIPSILSNNIQQLIDEPEQLFLEKFSTVLGLQVKQQVAEGIKVALGAVSGGTRVGFIAAIFVLWGFEMDGELAVCSERLGTTCAWVTAIFVARRVRL